ncbi:YdiU family protein [Methylobacillus gramineus]|uniref:protein adenylyltransferase SelO n=1 Tax=Methylobacillus gramineus TaxID=755169 RepID=UPI001CFFE2A4|nr:YdiU family protein [Methylobacillus gramineus]MCB5184644.1 YdiU family protein [Methylobacillus gramineus]
MLTFDNRFLQELPGDPDTSNQLRQVFNACWSRVMPTPVAAPTLLAYSEEMLHALELSEADIQSADWVNALSGNGIIPGMQPYAMCYGGHQFGNWAGQLGDGRAISLGEVINSKGDRWELQLKGAGVTPYSRMADGRAVLRSSVREFLCSEAMHHLGIPTTRALSLVQTGDVVIRDMFYNGNPQAEKGAIVCRVSPSFIRFGNFEIFAMREDKATLQTLVDFTINRDFPELAAYPQEERLAEWFAIVCVRTARLIAQWMRVGFVHGVMNTDNMSILGLTIDYGPYGWVDNFDPGWTPNTTDAAGRRYCFGRQPDIARWNLERLAQALYSLQPEREIFDEGLMLYDQTYNKEWGAILAAKFGFALWRDDYEPMINEVFDLMYHAEIDMTEFFRKLALVDATQPDLTVLESAAYSPALWDTFKPRFTAWLNQYAHAIHADDRDPAERRQAMNSVNPRYVLRNYLAQQAIDLADQGDSSMIDELLDVLRKPYDEQPGKEGFAALRPDWARHKAGCSMLSCSS